MTIWDSLDIGSEFGVAKRFGNLHTEEAWLVLYFRWTRFPWNQYLRTSKIPVLEYKIAGSTLSYRWADVVPGFNMQVGVTLAGTGFTVVHPTEAWQTARLELANPADFAADANYYVIARPVKG